MSRTKIGYRSGSKEAYQLFKETHPETELTFRQFYDIIMTWNTSIMEHIIHTGDEVKLPYGFGVLTIAKYKQKKKRITKDGREIMNLSINWAATRAEGKKVYHMNFHTDGYKYFWKWDSKRSYFKASSIWAFKAHRYFARYLAKQLKESEEIKNLYKDNTI